MTTPAAAAPASGVAHLTSRLTPWLSAVPPVIFSARPLVLLEVLSKKGVRALLNRIYIIGLLLTVSVVCSAYALSAEISHVASAAINVVALVPLAAVCANTLLRLLFPCCTKARRTIKEQWLVLLAATTYTLLTCLALGWLLQVAVIAMAGTSGTSARSQDAAIVWLARVGNAMEKVVVLTNLLFFRGLRSDTGRGKGTGCCALFWGYFWRLPLAFLVLLSFAVDAMLLECGVLRRYAYAVDDGFPLVKWCTVADIQPNGHGHHHLPHDLPTDTLDWLRFASALTLAVTLGVLLYSIFVTKLALDEQPYLQTRTRQLLFRFFLFLIWPVALCAAIMRSSLLYIEGRNIIVFMSGLAALSSLTLAISLFVLAPVLHSGNDYDYDDNDDSGDDNDDRHYQRSNVSISGMNRKRTVSFPSGIGRVLGQVSARDADIRRFSTRKQADVARDLAQDPVNRARADSDVATGSWFGGRRVAGGDGDGGSFGRKQYDALGCLYGCCIGRSFILPPDWRQWPGIRRRKRGSRGRSYTFGEEPGFSLPLALLALRVSWDSYYDNGVVSEIAVSTRSDDGTGAGADTTRSAGADTTRSASTPMLTPSPSPTSTPPPTSMPTRKQKRTSSAFGVRSKRTAAGITTVAECFCPEKNAFAVVMRASNDLLGQTLCVGFRGTNFQEWQHVLTDLNMLLEPLSVISGLGARDLRGVKVHSGFQQAYGAVRGQVLAAVRAELTSPEKRKRRQGGVRGVGGGEGTEEAKDDGAAAAAKAPTTALPKSERPPLILVSGHSMGAALATLAALDFAAEFPSLMHRIRIITFGSPRVGNYRFASLYARQFSGPLGCVPGGQSFRVVFQRDAFTSGPKLLGYKHVDQLVHMDGRGNCVVDPSPIERIFVRSYKTSFLDHSLTKYEDALTSCMQLQRGRGREEEEDGMERKRDADIHALLFRSDASLKHLRGVAEVAEEEKDEIEIEGAP